MIKLCAFDMDGTLLNDEEAVSEENRKALRQLEERGVGILLATGRSELFVKNYIKELNIRLPVISCNGAIVRLPDTGELLNAVPMARNACRMIIDICSKYGLYFQMFGIDSMFLSADDPVRRRIEKINCRYDDKDHISFTILDNPKEILNRSQAIYRIKVDIDDRNLKEKVEDEVNTISGISACFSDFNLLECIHEDASKGNALKLVSEKMGISRDQVAAFGDSYNDLSMFGFAGISVAMGNAEDKIQSKAKYVTRRNHESGVAYGINKYILENDE
jgi:Cof subfamily protein (haloacid dehalogenase superfamily)